MYFERKALLKRKNIKYSNKRNAKIIKKLNQEKFSSIRYLIIIVPLIIIFLLLFYLLLKKNKTNFVQNESKEGYATEHTTKNKINQIPIASSLNNNYVYPIIVSITSILYNSVPNNFFTFYLLLAPDVQEENLKKISGLKDKYPNCKFVFLRVENHFKNFHRLL